MTPERSTRTSLAVSIALHIVFGVVLVRAVVYSVPREDRSRRPAEPSSERVAFVATPTLAAVTNAGRSGGDGRPRTGRAVTPLRAPVAIPSVLPPVAPSAPTGSGEVIGAGGPTAGIRPTYSDPRLWTPVGPFISPALTPAERLDSSLTERLRAFRDSMAAVAYAPNKMERGDWTVEHNGEKYGIDRQFIRLGKFSLPTAALALLPFNQQANPITGERERQYNAMHAEIQEQAQRAMNIEEFRAAAKAIRERKDRERRERQQAPASGQAASTPQAQQSQAPQP
jgi:hypothetical protein